MRRRVLVIIGGVGLVLVVVARIVARSTTPGEAIDTTGASGRRVTPAAGAPAAGGRAGAGGPAAATPARITPTAVVVEVRGTAIKIENKPLLLLNPSSVRQGSNVGVTGSGFDAGATVDLSLKQREQNQDDVTAFVQVDKSGSFGGVNLTVPPTVLSGSFIVEARQRNSDKAARATGLIAGGAPQVKLGTGVGKPGDVVQLSAEFRRPLWRSPEGQP